MRTTTVVGLIVAGAVLLVASSFFYTVDEREQALVTFFGEVVDLTSEPGLHTKGPVLWEVHRLPKNVLEWEGAADQIPTRDKKFIFVDTFARWRIADLRKFYVSVQTERGAQSRLDDIIDGATRDVVTDHDLLEIVRNSNRTLVQSEEGYGNEGEATQIKLGRLELAHRVHERAAAQTLDKYGIELLDVQFKRINYVPEVQRKVFDRMISERKRIAELFRAEGRRAASEIRGQQERELKKIESEAYRVAEEKRGAADAEATRVYTDAYGRDPDFFAFSKTLESYRNTLGAGTTIVLDTRGDYLRYLDSAHAAAPPAAR